MSNKSSTLPGLPKRGSQSDTNEKPKFPQDLPGGESDENPERGNWSSKTEYLLSMIGYAVGLGNVWRFPYLAYKNGGGAFLIPYAIMLALTGLPLFFLECSLGQFASQGPISVWKAVPILQGKIIQNTIETSRQGATREGPRSYRGLTEQETLLIYMYVPAVSHVVYFTATFPYVVLLILLIRGATLEGAQDGISYYIGKQSDFSKLRDAEVWKDAAGQIFYSLSVSWGGLISLSSYNKFHNNCYSDAITISIINCLTSVFAGFCIFSVLGHMAHISGKAVPEVAQSGFGLAFIVYPEALSQLPVSPLWSILFFLMLLTLGLDSQFAIIETIITAIQDKFPHFVKSKRVYVITGCCIILYLLGLTCVTQAGIYWVNLIDHFSASWGLLITALLELIGINWIYGTNKFIKDIEMMIGKKSWFFWLWWRLCWSFVSPCLLFAILIWYLATFVSPSYGSVQYPSWGIALGWIMIIFCIIWIPIVAIMKTAKAEGNLWQRIRTNCHSTDDWGPYLECHRGERYKRLIIPQENKEPVFYINNLVTQL
nr:PREDICTED: sodium- and chloride-dependent neutral and basic amino acid transporter B(0+)-like [Latimeria chalumnae]|eukprot:XP_014351735.1 PREDICTED: sodium- and chloride-dependent neutral and basic amino acid transporter B(0+)-like [Latimeria chalumnae]